jgi:hypothetical protein
VPIALLVPERTPNAFATALPLGATGRRATTQSDSRAALLFEACCSDSCCARPC